MIRGFRHKRLRRLYEDDDPRGVNPSQVKRLKVILARLDAAKTVADMDFAGLRLHPLKGELKGFWAVDVSGNVRVIFRFEGEQPDDVDYGDYH